MRLRALAVGLLVIACATGCVWLTGGPSSGRLLPGRYTFRLTSPQLSRAVVSPATVAVVENDLVIDTFAFSSESIRLTGSMNWGAIRAKAAGMSGLDTMTINLKGKVTSQMSAEGTCVSFRTVKEAYRGKWVLTPLPAGGKMMMKPGGVLACILALACATGCAFLGRIARAEKLVTGVYVIKWAVPGTGKETAVVATVSALGADLVIDTRSINNQRLVIVASMGRSRIRLNKTTAEPDPYLVEFEGEVLSPRRAEGTFSYRVRALEPVVGTWVLVRR